MAEANRLRAVPGTRSALAGRDGFRTGATRPIAGASGDGRLPSPRPVSRCRAAIRADAARDPTVLGNSRDSRKTHARGPAHNFENRRHSVDVVDGVNISLKVVSHRDLGFSTSPLVTARPERPADPTRFHKWRFKSRLARGIGRQGLCDLLG
jgi:hypothetical protein